MPGHCRAFVKKTNYRLRQGNGACTAVHGYGRLVITSSVAIVDGACATATMRSGHYSTNQPIAAAFAAQGGSNVLAVGYTVAGHAAATRDQKYIVGAYSRSGITCNHFDGACGSTVAAHIGRGGNGDVAGAVDNRIGAIEGIAATDAAGNGVIVYEIIGKCHAEAASRSATGAGVADQYDASAETTVATQTIGSAVIDGDGAWRCGGIARYRCTGGQGKTFGTIVQIRLVYNVLIHAKKRFKLSRFGGLILFFGSFYLVVFLARHGKQADA